MDLSKLSTEDLLALKAGDLSKVSTEGLRALKGESAPKGVLDSAIDSTKDDLAQVPKRLGNLAAGAVRGAGSIGATLLAPVDATARSLNGGKPVNVGGFDIVGQDRRAGMDGALQDLGADTNSLQFQAGKLGTEVLGTMGVGGAVANGLRPFAPVLANAVASGGFNAPGANMLTRMLGGAINGGATAGLVDPGMAGYGAALGGALPPAAKAAAYAGQFASDRMAEASKRLMQSAIKPTIKQLRDGDAEVAVNTLLDYGINPNEAGVNKLRTLIDDLNARISDKVANSTTTVNKGDVLDVAWPARAKFANQVDPQSDLNAIDAVAERFYLNPRVPNNIPVQQAQELKQGTYRVLAKKYGQIGSAEVEGQKALARGLKEEIAKAVPEVSALNAEESKLIRTLGVTERRALMELNKNPMGLASLAHNPVGWAAFMADKSALFKSLAARMVNASSGAPASGAALLENSGSSPLMRSLVLRSPAAIEANP